MTVDQVFEMAMNTLSREERQVLARRLTDNLRTREEQSSFLAHVEDGRRSARDEPTIPFDEARARSRERLEKAIEERNGEAAIFSTS